MAARGCAVAVAAERMGYVRHAQSVDQTVVQLAVRIVEYRRFRTCQYHLHDSRGVVQAGCDLDLP